MAKLKAYLQKLRSGEVLLMTGFALIGAFFSLEEISVPTVLLLLAFFIGIFFLFSAIYSINSWFGYTADLENKRMGYLKGTPVGIYIASSFIFGALAFAALGLIDLRLLFAGAVSLALWTLYSLPRIGLKGVAFGGTLLHFISHIIHFNMGYILYKPISAESLAVSIYFSLLFAGGHFHHEAIDYATDKRSRLKTAAVSLGWKGALNLSFSLFALAALYWATLYHYDIIGFRAFAPFMAAFALQGLLRIYFDRWLGDTDAALLYRTSYRIFYLLAGIAFIIFKCQ